MSAILRIPIVLLLLPAVFSGDDPYCPTYPQPVRQAYLSRLEMERAVHAASTDLIEPVLIWSGARNIQTLAGNNFIDDYTVDKMRRGGRAGSAR